MSEEKTFRDAYAMLNADRAVIIADVTRFVREFDDVWYAAAPVATRVADAVALAIKQSRAHPLLATLMLSEPETVALQFMAEGGETLPEGTMVRALLLANL